MGTPAEPPAPAVPPLVAPPLVAPPAPPAGAPPEVATPAEPAVTPVPPLPVPPDPGGAELSPPHPTTATAGVKNESVRVKASLVRLVMFVSSCVKPAKYGRFRLFRKRSQLISGIDSTRFPEPVSHRK
jgi:hypothetical protein